MDGALQWATESDFPTVSGVYQWILNMRFVCVRNIVGREFLRRSLTVAKEQQQYGNLKSASLHHLALALLDSGLH